MSTDYYLPAEPVSSLRLEEGELHDRLSVWENGALAGVLTLSSGAGRTIARFFASDDPVFHLHYGGYAVGCVVSEVGGQRSLAGSTCLISESGEITTAGELRRLAGSGRQEASDAAAS